MRKFDYASISLTIAGSCIPPFYYGFSEEYLLERGCYVIISLVCAAVALFIVLVKEDASSLLKALVFVIAPLPILIGFIHLSLSNLPF